MDHVHASTVEQQALFSETGETWEQPEKGDCDLRKIIGSFAELPTQVRRARFACIEERSISRKFLTSLVTQPPPSTDHLDWKDRLLQREESLYPYFGKTLLCVFIQIPGAHYTVEVDPESEKVAYWERHAV